MLEGLRSRCSTPRWWACATASQTCVNRSSLARTVGAGSARCAQRSMGTPSTHSIRSTGWPVRLSAPRTVTIPGCDSAAAASTSRSKRARARAPASEPAASRLSAITRSVPGCTALKTAPCPPRPISSISRYGPSRPNAIGAVASRTIVSHSSSSRSKPNAERSASASGLGDDPGSRWDATLDIHAVLLADLLGDQFLHSRLDPLAHLVHGLLAHLVLGRQFAHGRPRDAPVEDLHAACLERPTHGLHGEAVVVGDPLLLPRGRLGVGGGARLGIGV